MAILNRYWKLFLFHLKNRSFIMGFEKPYSMISIRDTVLDKCKTYSSFLVFYSCTPPPRNVNAMISRIMSSLGFF